MGFAQQVDNKTFSKDAQTWHANKNVVFIKKQRRNGD